MDLSRICNKLNLLPGLFKISADHFKGVEVGCNNLHLIELAKERALKIRLFAALADDF
jgi:hypothetical protein